MSAPVVTPLMREFAAGLVAATQADAVRNGYPFDAIKAQFAIREALTTLYRYDPRDAFEEPAGLSGRSRDDDEQADRMAGFHYPRDLSGDLR